MKNAGAKIIILLVLTSFGALAQSPLRFGIHASPNLSYVQSDDPSVQNNTALKFGFGLMAEYNFADNYSLSTGADYVFRGGELTLPVATTFGEVERTGTYKAGFIQIPVLLKMRTREFGYFRYFAEFGGKVGFSPDEDVTFDPPLADERKDSYIKFAEAMFTIGLGTEYSLGGGTSLLAGIYYNRSLFDNINAYEAQTGASKEYNYRFDYVNLKLGVLF